MKEIKYKLKGLDCANCAMKIEDGLNKMHEVENASVNFANLIAKVNYKEYTSDAEAKVVAEVVRIEDEVEVVKMSKESFDSEHHHECGCGHDHSAEKHTHSCGCGHDHEEGHNHEHHAESESIASQFKWNVTGIDCANCALKIEDKLNKVAGVKSATLNFATGQLNFDLNQGVDQQVLFRSMKQIIQAEESEAVISEVKKEVVQSTNHVKQKLIPIVSGSIILILADLMKADQFTISLILFLLAYLIVGYPVLKKATKNIIRGDVFDENFLMSIATIGAFIIGDYAEAVFVMIFYAVGEMFQSFAVGKSRDSITALMNIKSEIAHKWVDGETIDVHPEMITVGTVILVKPGERIPLDGQVIEGNSSIDTSALTGESIPLDVDVSHDVMAGCVNLNGLLKIRVSKPYGESTVSKILELVENASSRKAQTEQKITQFARIYTPIVVVLAIAIAFIPLLFNTGYEWSVWLLRACTFLVISCPCALVLSVPLGYFAGLGAASKVGVLVKGGNYLEVLKDLDTIVFDKTGTLTSGTFEVKEIISENTEETLELAAVGESFSTHPIALSIVKAYGKSIDQKLVKNLEESAGFGITGNIKGFDVAIGNKRLMEQVGIKLPSQSTKGTVVHVAKNGLYLGTITISDTIKPGTKKALEELKQNGIKKTIMLSGDRNETANQVAKEIGIDEVHAQLLPEDKVSEIEKILADKKYGKVAFVGDGINDAPVLARCDLGIAMGGIGSEAAIEAADIIIMKDNIDAIPKAIKIAKKTQTIMNQNIAFVLLIKICFLGLAGTGHANMWMGVFADVGVSIIAILNATRILKIK